MSPRPTRHARPKAPRADLPAVSARTASTTPIRPVHRGPAASAHSSAGSTIHHDPNAALLIDFDNVTMGIRSDLQTELRNLLSSAIVKGKVTVQRAYADWRRYPQYIVPLAEASIDTIMAPAYGSAKKNATDIRLAVDAMELMFTRPQIGTFILLSGDSDFSSLVMKLKEYGKYVIGVGIRESSSDLLVQNCDEYYSYNALAGLVKSGEEEIVKRDPWELVTEAVERMIRNHDVMRADRLKQVMQQIDSTFDEKDLGMAKFSRFVTEAAQKGLLTLTKLENGQFEVGLPGAKTGVQEPSAAAETTQHAAATKPAGERPRRGRRGGRGGGRTREAAGSEATGSVGVETAPVAAAARAPIAAEPVEAEIGSSGLRLTREDAFTLVRRAVERASRNGEAPRASAVRVAARELLGRDSESLSERNFIRILQDAHAADVIDLRKRGSDYEVGVATSAAPVAEQLAVNAPAAPKPVAQASRAGSVPRGRGPIGAKRGEVPADLFSVGVVPSWGEGEPTEPATESVAVEMEAEPEPATATGSGEGGEGSEGGEGGEGSEAARPRRPRRPRKPAAEGEEGKPAAKRPARKTRATTDEEV